MDTKLLEAFRSVMDNGSVTGAARVLGLTQPAVSAQIARLEAQVGFELFDRAGGRLRATDRGRQFFDEVRTALGTIERLAGIAESIRSGASETVAVASHPSASISLLPKVVAELLARRPFARVRMVNRTSEEVGAIFEAGGADVAIAEWPIHVQGVHVRRYAVPCVAVLPAGHPLAGREALGAADLSGQPIVAMSETRLIGHRLRAAFGEAGAEFRPVADSEFFSTICGLVASGVGIGIVDPWSAETFSGAGLVSCRFEPALVYEICVFRRASTTPRPLVEELLGLVDRRIRTTAGEAMASKEDAR